MHLFQYVRSRLKFFLIAIGVVGALAMIVGGILLLKELQNPSEADLTPVIKFFERADIYQCSADADCSLIKGICGEPTSINTAFVKELENIDRSIKKGKISCPAVLYPKIETMKAVCGELRCRAEMTPESFFEKLIFRREQGWGPCPPEGEPCQQTIRLYDSGHLVASGNKKYEKNINSAIVEKIKEEIRNNLLTRDCTTDSFLADYSANYFIAFGGQTKEIAYPACQEELRKIEGFIGIDSN